MFVFFSVFYILVAASMIVLILMQRGAGADAGSGFGGGASATVFGARGSSNFMSRATAVLAGSVVAALGLPTATVLGLVGEAEGAAGAWQGAGASVMVAALVVGWWLATRSTPARPGGQTSSSPVPGS